MTHSKQEIRFEVVVRADQANLLEGLALWQELGLLSEEQVRKLCRQQLSCPLPQQMPAAALPAADSFIPAPTLPAQPSPTPSPAPRPAWLSQRVQALMEEISIIWLLFLGVFLVVVSSGVLAASQWQNFSATGQYLVLLAYTIAFFGAATWTTQRPTLRLTTQMLRLATLLLLPLNFWRMDAIALWNEPWGWAIAPVAALVLSVIGVKLLRAAIAPPVNRRWVIVMALALSWLHWGWALPAVPLIASYAATIGTALTLTTQFASPSEEEHPAQPTTFGQAVLVLLVSVLVVLARAWWSDQVPFEQLGLAFGLCGGVLCWQTRHLPTRRLWGWVGIALLLLGWAATIGTQPPWQAIAISLIAIALLLDHLARTSHRRDLVALFLVGLQTWLLLGEMIPLTIRQEIFAWLSQWAGTEGMPWAVLGVTVFPCVMATAGVGRWYERRSQPQLSLTANYLALLLGGCLLLLGATNRLMSALTFTLACLTLVATLYRRESIPLWAAYLVQGLGLGAIATWIAWGFPSLPLFGWSLVMLALALAEWGLCLRSHGSVQQTAWHMGLALAALGGLLFWSATPRHPWGLLWLVVPLALTVLAYRRTFLPYKTAIASSSVAAVLVQGLTYTTWTSRLLSLGLMTGLLFWNVRRLPLKRYAIIHVGLGLCFIGALFWRLWEGLLIAWTVPPPLMIAMLWGLWHWQSGRETPLSGVYRVSLRGWAIALSSLTLLVFLGNSLLLFFVWPPELQDLVSMGILLAAIAYRLWLCPTNLGFFSLATAAELLLLLLIAWVQPVSSSQELTDRFTTLAIVNLALGLVTQVVGDLGTVRYNRSYSVSWHIIPLSYGLIGMLVGHLPSFNATTGLYTLAFALVSLGVGRRHSYLQTIAYLGLLLITAGLYELLIYQLTQAPAGATGDGIILLAGLAALLSVGDRLLCGNIATYLRVSPRGVRWLALAHWILGSSLLLASLGFDRSQTGGLLWIGVALILAVDALWQGHTQEILTYFGIAMAVAALMYGLWLAFPDSTALMAWAGAIASPLACGLYLVRWPRLGWSDRPWKQSALVLPLLLVISFASWVNIPTLFIVGAFYAWAAKMRRQVRLSYISVVLANWGILSWLDQHHLQEALIYASLLGLSLLYLAQVDPSFQSTTTASAQQRESRHWLRILAVGLIVLTSLYEAEQSLGKAVIALAIALILILTGLSLRIRAYLFVGTLAFIYQVLRQLVLLISTYPLLLWAVGIVLGLLFIWIAANFETRRSQMTTFVRHWVTTLEQWE